MKTQELYSLYTSSYIVSIDTRKITKGSLFFALKGDRFNGNKFAEEAILKGAAYAIIDDVEYLTSDSRIILVDNVLKTLQELSTHHRLQLKVPIIALTGSNGKTTTKELINAVLSTNYKTKATLGNLNNHIGVPLTLLSMTTDTEIGIVEMGANHLGEIDFLCQIAQPDYGYITNFGKAHLEGFGSLDGVIQGKTELYRYLGKQSKTLFVNIDDAKQFENSEGIDRITFGSVNANLPVELEGIDPYVNVKFNSTSVKTNLIGAYNFSNIAAAIAIGKHFKVNDKDIKVGIESFTPPNNRSQILQNGSNKIILDAYNANPTSMQVALENLSGLKDSNKIAILGDMFELGLEAKAEHQFITDLVASSDLNMVFLVGENFHNTVTDDLKVNSFKTYNDLKNRLLSMSVENTTILIKASRGMALERVIDLL